MTRFCGIFSPRDPSLMRREDIAAMLGAMLRAGPVTEGSFFDDAGGFGVAGISHDMPAGPAFVTNPASALVMNGFVRRPSGDGEAEAEEAGQLLLATLNRGESPEPLAGEFSGAWWDGERHELTLVTDPLGKHAVFYFQDEATGLVAFASEVKSLLAHPMVRRQVDPLSLSVYLFDRHVPSPLSAFEGIRRVFYGETLRFDAAGNSSSDLYWSYRPKLDHALTLGEWGQFLYERHLEMFTRLLHGHETVAVFLGAGLDSSLIYGMIKTHFPGVRCLPVTAYYEEGTHKSPDLDLPFARRLAEHWGDDLVEVEISPRTVGHRLETLLRQADQPFYRFGNNVSYDAMATAATARGATLLLTGQGGGESFGLNTWVRMQQGQPEGWLPTFDNVLEYQFQSGGVFTFERVEKLLGIPVAQSRAALEPCYLPLEQRVPSEDLYDRILYGFRQAGVREHLFHSSAATMAHHPARVMDAFYDWQTYLACSLAPSEYKGKLDPAMSRAVFHLQQTHLIPQFIFDRKKRGLPGLNLTSFPSLERHLLSREVVERHGIFNPDYFEKVSAKRELRQSLLVAQAWLDIHVFRDEESFALIEADVRG